MIDPDLIERAHAAFTAEYARLWRPGGNEADHADAERAALEAVTALVQGERDRYKAALEAMLHDVASATGRLRLALRQAHASRYTHEDTAVLVTACQRAREALASSEAEQTAA